MNRNSCEIIDKALDLSKLGVSFTSKPLIIGGLAMEYYGLRKRGQDIDLIITSDDYNTLVQKYPNNKKDIWGDVGIVVYEFEIWRSIMLLDYDFFSESAAEYDEYKIVSFDRLFLTRVMAANVEKYKKDLDLMINHYLKNQNPEFMKYAEKYFEKYKSVPGGVIFNDEYFV